MACNLLWIQTGQSIRRLRAIQVSIVLFLRVLADQFVHRVFEPNQRHVQQLEKLAATGLRL